MACGIYFPDQGWNPAPPALGARRLGHWTTREVRPSSILTWRLPLNFFQKLLNMESPKRKWKYDEKKWHLQDGWIGASHIIPPPMEHRFWQSLTDKGAFVRNWKSSGKGPAHPWSKKLKNRPCWRDKNSFTFPMSSSAPWWHSSVPERPPSVGEKRERVNEGMASPVMWDGCSRGWLLCLPSEASCRTEGWREAGSLATRTQRASKGGRSS